MAAGKSPGPISGEILSGVFIRPEGLREALAALRSEAVDAEYESVFAAVAINRAPPKAVQPHVHGLEILRRGYRYRSNPKNTAFWLFGLLAVAGAFWASGGHAVLNHAAPRLERPAPSPLRIAGLESSLVEAQGRTLLIIRGEAVNDGPRLEHLPDFSINLLDPEGRTSHYILGTNGNALSAGGRFAFSSRLPVPKGGVKSVSVTFKERAD